MKLKFVGIVLTFILVSAPLNAQRISSSDISKVGTTVAQFLKIDVSARSIAMGGSFVAIANDASAIYTNPAGLARVSGYQAMFTHTEWIAGTKYDFGAVTLNLTDIGSIGFMVSSFSSGDMAVTTLDNPDGTGALFDVQDLLIGLAYSRNLTNNFSIGFTGKYIYQRLWHSEASSMAIDVGTLFNTPFWGIVLGTSIRNFGAKMQLDGRDIKFAYDPDNRNTGNVNVVNAQYEMQKYPLPLYFQVGLAKTLNFGEQNKLTIAVDALTPNDNFESVNTGFEYGWNQSVFLRAGYKSLFQKDTEEGMTAGLGFNLRLEGTMKIQVDYAYADFGRLDNSQRFTLMLHF
ncbi:MAG: hypothetical protein D8M58_08480 [Calditrichaeota bacterium]|nr:MAG: hypothetical protein DWQ03_18010 [Calditrichota bacterium]MBL1205418.1 hypothetical protein [Calditrichota bacterium]NOG45247.1 PorV/PorQ family protein [Calditrichota bacterium]